MDLIQLIKQKAATYKAEVIAIRQHLHQHPELSFREFKTADFIENKLNEYGITNQKRLVKTGIIALIEGTNPSKKIIALRSDHDALPIQETNEVDYKSVNNGVMHACGHDVHTSSLLGVAKILNELKNEFEGTVKLIFQPGEEIIPGGASLIIKEGGLENPSPSKMFGQHVYPQLEAGKVGFRPGMYMASADEIYVTVKGKGGHAALPQQNIDPILIASHIVVALQQIVSRGAHPTIPTVLSFGKIIGNGATNIIPDEVKLEGTFRTMNEEWRAKAHQKMKKMAEDIAEGMGGECIFDIHVGYPFLVNDEELTARAKQGAIEFLGEKNVVDLDLRMTAEDFAFYSQLLPACFYRLGVKNDQKQINSGLHTSTFNIDEDALEIGMGLMTWLTIKELQA
ncbi:MAG: amidohydrolase [Flavobacteriales bacterium]|nr:amidohydrolase [Flavobacteriales bacterium]MCB9363545.1 amidohydrolase [Flavobacteriales bacterium]